MNRFFEVIVFFENCVISKNIERCIWICWKIFHANFWWINWRLNSMKIDFCSVSQMICRSNKLSCFRYFLQRISSYVSMISFVSNHFSQSISFVENNVHSTFNFATVYHCFSKNKSVFVETFLDCCSAISAVYQFQNSNLTVHLNWRVCSSKWHFEVCASKHEYQLYDMYTTKFERTWAYQHHAIETK